MQLDYSPNVARSDGGGEKKKINRFVDSHQEKRRSYAPKFMAVCALHNASASSRCGSGDVTAPLLFT